MASFSPNPSSSLAEGRDEYFRANGFGPNGGYDEAWVDFKLGPIPMPIPNTAGRVRAVRFHDLHHVLTGYATDTLGEFEISAWEIGSGCRDFVAAWVLNLSGLFAGALSIPRRTWRAFARGRHSMNLYGSAYDERLLRERVGDARRRLHLDPHAPPIQATATDVVAFAGALAGGFAVGTFMLVLIVPAAIAGNIVAAVRRPASAR